MKRKPALSGVILCPDDPRWAKGTPTHEVMAHPWHLLGKKCKLCGHYTAEHSIIIEEGKK